MKRQSGFSLVEIMVVVAIIVVVTAIALPSYRDYIIKSRLTEAFSSLASAHASAEQFWSNNRTYAGFSTATGLPANTANFTFVLSNDTASTFTITATAAADPISGAVYTIDQNGNRATTSAPTTWGGGSSTTCWINGKGGACVQ